MIRISGDRWLKLARRYFDCEADCADAVQDALVAAVRHWPNFRGSCRIETWLHRIVTNTCLMKLRSQSRRRVSSSDVDNMAQRPAERTIDERRQMVRDALVQLTQSQRTVIQLRYFEGFSTKEAAELLGIEPDAVKTRLHRSCRALGRVLRNQTGAV